jgi:hypothetical protein
VSLRGEKRLWKPLPPSTRNGSGPARAPLKENDGKSKPVALRERMEQHRKNPVCATCHQRMDPIGFALENFDATGRWRLEDSGAPVDSRSAMNDGTELDGPVGLRQTLIAGGDFVRALTSKVMTYALGRGMECYDEPAVRRVVHAMTADNYRSSPLILGVVKSAPFQMRVAASTPADGRQASVGKE